MGTGLPDGSGSVVRQPILNKRPSCDAMVDYMLAWGLNIDVSVEVIMRDNGLALAGGGRVDGGGGGLGPYAGRINKNERQKGSSYRLVPGLSEKTYRIIQLA